jgi:hypothetical protein
MPLTFLNGTPPDYLGFSFTNSTSLLTAIHDTLVTAGCTSLTNTPGSGIVELLFNATDNSDNCAIRLTTSIPVAGRLRLSVRMAHTSSFTILSNEWRLECTNGSTNRLWLTCNQDHLAMVIQDFSGSCQSLYAGYLLRLDPSDTYAFVIGIPNTVVYDNSTSFNGQATNSNFFSIQIGRDFSTNSINWFYPQLGYFGSLSFNAGGRVSPINGPYFGFGFINRHCVAHLPAVDSNQTSSSNAARNCLNGNSNGLNNKTVLGEYYFVEGNTTDSSYGTNKGILPPELYFRGVVQSVTVGMSHLLDGVQVTNNLGQRFISGGGLTYQGIRIL